MVSLMPTPWNDATRLVRAGVKGYAPAHTAAPVRERQYERAGEAPARIALRNRMIDGREVAANVAARHVVEAVATFSWRAAARHAPCPRGWRSHATPEEQLDGGAEGVLRHPVPERRGGDDAALRPMSVRAKQAEPRWRNRGNGIRRRRGRGLDFPLPAEATSPKLLA